MVIGQKMIAIVNYDKTESAALKHSLEDAGIEKGIFLSIDENEMCKAEKVILPDTKDLKKAIRLLQFHNFYSLLKLLKKPILGINTGAAILCDNINKFASVGLGFIPVDVECKICSIDKTLSPLQHKIIVSKETPLLTNLSNDATFHFPNEFMLNKNEFTTSYVQHDGEKFSATIEKDHHYGIFFDPVKSGESGMKVLKNFIDL